MCHGKPCARLRSWIILHPPLVGFFLCVVTLAFALLAFGGYIQTHSVRDADVTQDWDTFLQALCSLHFCPLGNQTDGLPARSLAGSLPAASEGLLDPPGSVSTLVRLKQSHWHPATNLTGLRMLVSRNQDWMKGITEDARLVVTVFPVEESGGCNKTDADCLVTSCVSVSGPQHLLPKSRAPLQCALGDSKPEVFLDLHSVSGTSEVVSDCFRLGYYGDPELKTMISQVERTLCAGRLLHTALSLLFLAAVFCMLSVLCTQPAKDKRVQGPL